MVYLGGENWKLCWLGRSFFHFPKISCNNFREDRNTANFYLVLICLLLVGLFLVCDRGGWQELCIFNKFLRLEWGVCEFCSGCAGLFQGITGEIGPYLSTL